MLAVKRQLCTFQKIWLTTFQIISYIILSSWSASHFYIMKAWAQVDIYDVADEVRNAKAFFQIQVNQLNLAKHQFCIVFCKPETPVYLIFNENITFYLKSCYIYIYIYIYIYTRSFELRMKILVHIIMEI